MQNILGDVVSVARAGDTILGSGLLVNDGAGITTSEWDVTLVGMASQGGRASHPESTRGPSGAPGLPKDPDSLGAADVGITGGGALLLRIPEDTLVHVLNTAATRSVAAALRVAEAGAACGGKPGAASTARLVHM